MLKSITVTNHMNESLKLELMNPEKSGFIIRNVEGLSPPKADINTRDLATADGSTFASSRLESRNIVIDLIFLGVDIEATRQKTYKYFPISSASGHRQKIITLLIETDHRIATIKGYVESNEANIFTKQEGCQISIICPDPNFYSAGENNGITTTVFYGVVPNFTYPFSNESLTDPLLEYGIIKNKAYENVKYYGESEIGFVIYINAVGRVENLTIYNTDTRETIFIDTAKLEELTGDVIINGDAITITTVQGLKSAILLRDGVYTNIYNCLGKNPSWFTLSPIDNLFAFTAIYGPENLQFRIENNTVYDGM